MIRKQCDQCPKIIEGYTEKQIGFMLEQHKLTHKLANKKWSNEVK